jgi:hypothetical protein
MHRVISDGLKIENQGAGATPRSLDGNALDFMERKFIRSAVIEVRRARAFVRRDGLCAFDISAIQQIGRKAVIPVAWKVWQFGAVPRRRRPHSGA